MNATWLRRLYVGLAVVAILPIWIAKYLPTSDGPSHLYNSWILRQLITGNDRVIAEWYAVDWRPYPNWSGHAALALMMSVVPPGIAEKLLVSGIVLLFSYGMWRYAGAVDAARRPFALLAFPLAYNLPLQIGLYNFSIGAALYFLILAVWWRRRDRPDVRTIAIIAALLLVCYFSHALPAVLALLSIGFLCLATLPGRRPSMHLRHLLAFVPVIPLLAWFGHGRGPILPGSKYTAWGLFSYIMRMWVIRTFEGRQTKLGFALFLAISSLIVMTLIRRRWRWHESDAFVVLTVGIVALYAFAPPAMWGGGMLLERMALFVVLSPFVWLDPRLPRGFVACVVVVLAIVSLAYTGYLARRYRGLSRRIAELVRSAEPIGQNSTILPLIRDVRPANSIVPILMHAIEYVAIAKAGVDMSNYEPATGYFPVRFRPGVTVPNVAIGPTVTEMDIGAAAPCAEYIFTWHVPPDAPVVKQIRESFDDVGGSEGGRVYRARRPVRPCGQGPSSSPPPTSGTSTTTRSCVTHPSTIFHSSVSSTFRRPHFACTRMRTTARGKRPTAPPIATASRSFGRGAPCVRTSRRMSPRDDG